MMASKEPAGLDKALCEEKKEDAEMQDVEREPLEKGGRCRDARCED